MRNTLDLIAFSDTLRSLSGEEVCVNFARVGQECFADIDDADAETPSVIICAHGEADDLPAALASLALSRQEVLPIVVDNNSPDDTARLALEMGAFVLTSTAGSKAGALQDGIAFVRKKISPETNILSADADNIFGPMWSTRMTAALNRPGIRDTGGIVFGPVLYRHGQDRVGDIARSMVYNGRQAAYSPMPRLPVPHGANVGIRLTDRQARATSEIDPGIFLGEDAILMDKIVKAGGKAACVLSPDALVITRGDRFSSLREMIAVALGLKTRAQLYEHDYSANNYVRDTRIDRLRSSLHEKMKGAA